MKVYQAKGKSFITHQLNMLQ